MNCQECYKSKQNTCKTTVSSLTFLHYPFLGRRLSVMHGPRNQLFCNILSLAYHLHHLRFQERGSSPGSCKSWRKVGSSPQSTSEVPLLNVSMDNALTERTAEGMGGTGPQVSPLLSDYFSSIAVTWKTMFMWTDSRKSSLWTPVLHSREFVEATKFMLCCCLEQWPKAVLSLTSCQGLLFLQCYGTAGWALASPAEAV